MDKTTTEAYLEDIRPSELRLRQVEYLLKLTKVEDDLKGVAWSERVNTYTTADTTGNSVARTLDKVTDLANERDMLLAKLELYYNWIKSLDTKYNSEGYLEIITGLYREGHSVQWLAIDKGESYNAIRLRKNRILEKLATVDIVAVTEQEKIANKS